ncbi:YdjY domain-containing protein [Akkermansiaceae bacterium]|nr:YdjY domain-containing protein [Akkermansiaceae bacterium]
MHTFVSILISFALLSMTSLSAEEVETIEIVEQPQIQQLNANEFQIGKVKVNRKTREISFGAGVNLIDRPLEYLLVNGKGKVHEALCITDVSPINLNIAIKLLGLKSSQELFEIIDEDYRPTGKFPDVPAKIKAAARLDIFLEWPVNGKTKRVSMNELIYNPVIEKTMAPGPWLYTGSYIHEGQFKAEIAGDLFALHPRQPAMVNYPGKDHTGENDWLPDSEKIPEEGTVVTFILTPHKS